MIIMLIMMLMIASIWCRPRKYAFFHLHDKRKKFEILSKITQIMFVLKRTHRQRKKELEQIDGCRR